MIQFNGHIVLLEEHEKTCNCCNSNLGYVKHVIENSPTIPVRVTFKDDKVRYDKDSMSLKIPKRSRRARRVSHWGIVDDDGDIILSYSLPALTFPGETLTLTQDPE